MSLRGACEAFQFLVQKVRHENADHHDSADNTQILEGPAGDAVQDVGDDQEFEAEQDQAPKADTCIVGNLFEGLSAESVPGGKDDNDQDPPTEQNDDKQVYDSVETLFGPLTKLTNVPESEIMGLEFEWQWRPALGLDVALSATYLDTEVEEYTDFYSDDLEGRDLPQTPEWQASGYAAYEFPVADSLSMRVMANFNYSDGYYTVLGNGGGLVNYEDMQVDDWFVTNGRITLFPDDGQWEVSLWGKNLTDEYYQQSLNWSNDVTFAMSAPGRTYGINLTYNWF